METIASWFEIFSNMWSPGAWGDLAWVFWPANLVICLVICVEGMTMVHLSRNRWHRLSYGLVALGAFTYAAGEIGGVYYVVAPVETLFHGAIVLGLWVTIWHKTTGRARASSYQRA